MFIMNQIYRIRHIRVLYQYNGKLGFQRIESEKNCHTKRSIYGTH